MNPSQSQNNFCHGLWIHKFDFGICSEKKKSLISGLLNAVQTCMFMRHMRCDTICLDH